MNIQEIIALMDRFDVGAAARMRLTMGDFFLELEKAGCTAAAPAAAQRQTAPAAEEHPADTGSYITAPVVGTFYAASAPDAAPFVRPGDRVRRGQTVCLLEAMKMMSEVQAPCDCVIEAVLPENGALVSFGDPLIRYREG